MGIKADLLTILTIFAGLKGKEIVDELLRRRRDIMIESIAYDLINSKQQKEWYRRSWKRDLV